MWMRLHSNKNFNEIGEEFQPGFQRDRVPCSRAECSIHTCINRKPWPVAGLYIYICICIWSTHASFYPSRSYLSLKNMYIYFISHKTRRGMSFDCLLILVSGAARTCSGNHACMYPHAHTCTMTNLNLMRTRILVHMNTEIIFHLFRGRGRWVIYDESSISTHVVDDAGGAIQHMMLQPLHRLHHAWLDFVRVFALLTETTLRDPPRCSYGPRACM
jgi:hypothetical protein